MNRWISHVTDYQIVSVSTKTYQSAVRWCVAAVSSASSRSWCGIQSLGTTQTLYHCWEKQYHPSTSWVWVETVPSGTQELGFFWPVNGTGVFELRFTFFYPSGCYHLTSRVWKQMVTTHRVRLVLSCWTSWSWSRSFAGAPEKKKPQEDQLVTNHQWSAGLFRCK